MATDPIPTSSPNDKANPQVGDIVCMMTQAHPIMGTPYEVIGRVERDHMGLHAGNRYLHHCWNIRILESLSALRNAKRFLESIDAHKHEDGFEAWCQLAEALDDLGGRG